MRDIGKSVKVDLPSGLLTNHSGRKTVAQILQDANVSEDAIMGITGHKSVEGVRAYKEVNEKQHLIAMKTLVNAINPSGSSIVGDSVNNSDVTPEFSSDNINEKEDFNSGNLIENPMTQRKNKERHIINTTNTSISEF